MDRFCNLVLINGCDRTEEIAGIVYKGGKCRVGFVRYKKAQFYEKHEVIWLKNPMIFESKNYVFFKGGVELREVSRVLEFGSYCRVTYYGGKSVVVRTETVVKHEKCLSIPVAKARFEYLREVAALMKIDEQDDEQKLSFLGREYDKIIDIDPRSVLHRYLAGIAPLQRAVPDSMYFPFGFNISQKAATERAFSEQVSVIEGPPGTGKTQTILNIIANAVIAGKSVAVVSNNNAATENVYEKLKKYQLEFFAAVLGNAENRKKFLENQPDYPVELAECKILDKDMTGIERTLAAERRVLDEMLEVRNRNAVLKQELYEWQTEYGYFTEHYSEFCEFELMLRAFFEINSRKAMKLLVEYFVRSDNNNTVLNRLRLLFLYGIYKTDLYEQAPAAVSSCLQKLFYEQKIRELSAEIERLTAKLSKYDFDDSMRVFTENSMKLFKAKLAVRYCKENTRKKFSKTDISSGSGFDNFVEEYPVILSTTHSLLNSSSQGYLFDYVIVDEASQADVVSGALTLLRANNVIVVGDTKQLPVVVPEKMKKQSREKYDLHNPGKAYDYSEMSMLSSVVEVFSGAVRTLLKEHYRCHPRIIGFCNRKFYDDQLVVLTESKNDDIPLVLYKTAPGNHARGTYNYRQIDVIKHEILKEHNIDCQKSSVGIASPFREQGRKLRKTIGNDAGITIDTVHKYQGRESDIIILTTVVNNLSKGNFVDDPNLLNVAVSRAKEKLFVVASNECEEWSGTNVGDLVKYIRYNNHDIIDSRIYSVFDLLYSRYSKCLKDIMIKNSSEYKSENLMLAVIEKVLDEEQFHNLSYVMKQPLNMLVRDTTEMDDHERKYVANPWTHCDFIIFNKMDKFPVLAIEVDGHMYHENNSKQIKRDRMKDKIMSKIGLPIIRFKTTGSMEEEKLRQKLVEVQSRGSEFE